MCRYDNSVSTMTGYGLDDRGSIIDRGKNFSLFHHVQIGTCAHLISCPINIGRYFPRDKARGA
jgi:hypothetical protein